MRRSSILIESFLDGFTMAGLFSKLRRPGGATTMFSPSTDRDGEWEPVTFELVPDQKGGVEVAGDLHEVPRPALRAMIALLEREDESRSLSAEVGKAGYGASR